ncbi:MAG: MoaD/ThiS family protein [Bacteroidales bacterium]|jgi:molybdopterin converting factor small subunit|nr:MoaD/ThiS family protein [Bacteroidales bacterium]
MEAEVRVLFFGAAQEATGRTEETFRAGDTASLRRIITDKYPSLAIIPFRLALNRTMLKDDSDLEKNDVIAILPPFQGG